MKQLKHRFIHFLHSTTFRLAASYLTLIMVLSLGFSFVLYRTSVLELGRDIPPFSLIAPDEAELGGGGTGYHHYFQRRIDEGREHLLDRLLLLNLSVLIVGAALSYYLARRTLQPIEEAAEAQSRFVTDASHELRTPLTAILTSNEVALRKPHLTTKEAKAVIKSNMEEMVRLKNLSDGLLDLSKRDAPDRSIYRPVSLQDVVGEAMNQTLPAAQAKNITVQDNAKAINVTGDMQSLVQMASILLDNAVKYSPSKSTVHLEGYRKDGYGCLSVRDEGSGIAPKDLPHIFDRFYRADQSRTNKGANGHGIGLSIARKIIEQHDGSVTVSSALGHGTTFVVQLPLAREQNSGSKKNEQSKSER